MLYGIEIAYVCACLSMCRRLKTCYKILKSCLVSPCPAQLLQLTVAAAPHEASSQKLPTAAAAAKAEAFLRLSCNHKLFYVIIIQYTGQVLGLCRARWWREESRGRGDNGFNLRQQQANGEFYFYCAYVDIFPFSLSVCVCVCFIPLRLVKEKP